MNITEEVNKKTSILVEGVDKHRLTWETEMPDSVRLVCETNFYRIKTIDIGGIIEALKKIEEVSKNGKVKMGGSQSEQEEIVPQTTQNQQ